MLEAPIFGFDSMKSAVEKQRENRQVQGIGKWVHSDVNEKRKTFSLRILNGDECCIDFENPVHFAI